MRKFRWLLVLGVVGSLILSSVSEAVDFTPVVAVGYSGGAIDSNTGYGYPYHSMSYGYGAIFGFSMFPKTMAQLGFLYLQRGFAESSSSLPAQQEVTFNTVQIPFTFHYYFVPSMAVGLGGYFSHGLGSISTYPEGDPGAATSSNYGPGSFGADDYGVVASLSLKLSLLPFVSVIFDGRYLYGLQNISQIPSMTVYLRDFQVLGGIQFGK